MIDAQYDREHEKHQMIGRANSVTDILRSARTRIENVRELPADVVAAFHDARLFRVLLPRSVEGEEADLRTHAEVLEIIASADASTAWCLSQGAGCAMGAAFLQPNIAQRIFGPNDAVLAWGRRPAGQGCRGHICIQLPTTSSEGLREKIRSH
ncbi:MAG: hypothetical protein ACR2OV_12310 [Hyphomicrobiaceae bacterium]